MESEHLRRKNRSQTNFIEAAKQLYHKQKTNLAFQISNYELRVAELEREMMNREAEIEALMEDKEYLEERIVKLSN